MSSTRDDSPTPCPDYSSLLLPFVDGELAEPDAHAVLEHMPHCDGCTEVVQEQQRVRALLSQVPTPAMPPNLLKRVHLALDEVDRETRTAQVAQVPASSWRDRLRAMLRGGLVMTPALAAAVLLWVSLRPEGAPSPAGDTPASDRVALQAPASDKAAPATLDPDALPASVPPPILGARTLPQDFEFVSAKPDVVHYRNARRNFRLIDRLQPARAPTPNQATLHQIGDQTYVLSRNAQGHAHLDFALGRHTHRLILVPEQASAQPGAISAQHPHFVEMLRFARALQRAAQP